MMSEPSKILVLCLAMGMVLAVGASAVAQQGDTAGQEAPSEPAAGVEAEDNSEDEKKAADDPASERKTALARQYLELTYQLASAEAIAKAVAAQIVRQRPGSGRIVEAAAEAVAPRFEDDVEALNAQVVAVYTKRFTAQELEAMVEFYQEFNASSAGQKLRAEGDEIAEEMGEISRVRGVAIGGEIYRALLDELSVQPPPAERSE